MTTPMTPTSSTARLLEIAYEGWFMARIATDPDPTNEERGMSGYTMALPRETRLDQVIRLQIDAEFYARNARPPLPEWKRTLGVFVSAVRFDGSPYPPAEAALLGAAVSFDGKDTFTDGPVLESRNNIVGSDDTMAFVLVPFQLGITKPAAGTAISAIDYLDPADPARQTWQFTDPAAYARRISTCTSVGDLEVQEATAVWDQYGYFRDRRHYLERLIGLAEAELPGADPARAAALAAAIGSYKSRIYQIDFWGDRVSSKLATRVDWDLDVNGPQQATGAFGGTIDVGTPWHTHFWLGGWDGDLLIGYMRGTLSMPFSPG